MATPPIEHDPRQYLLKRGLHIVRIDGNEPASFVRNETNEAGEKDPQGPGTRATYTI